MTEPTHLSAEELDKISRVEMMASGSPTWDLSDNDIAALQFVLDSLETARQTWRCFGCDFVTSDPKEAEAHFGDRDEASEFVPVCKWWAKSDDDDKKRAYQDLIIELNQARDEESAYRSHAEISVQNWKIAESELEAARRELAARWVPCSERLPGDYGLVIAYLRKAEYPRPEMILAWYWKTSWWGHFTDFDGKVESGEMPEGEVTHWQPLPAPPSETAKERNSYERDETL